MSYERWVSDVVQVVEAVGAGIMVVGGAVVLVRSLAGFHQQRPDAYRRLRRDLGRVIQVGLEVLIVADIVRTIIVVPTLTSVGVLATIVVIRIVLSWALESETTGVLPWRRAAGAGSGSGSGELASGP